MAGSSDRGARALWLKAGWGAIIVLAGLGASLALWDPLEIDEQSHIRHITAQTAESIRADLEADLRSRLLAQIRLGELRGWEEFTPPGILEWTLNCSLFLRHYPADLTLEWTDANGRVTWTMEGKHAPSSRLAPVRGLTLPPVVATARPSSAVGVSPAFQLSDGRTAVRVVVPVVRDGAPFGYLVSVFDAGVALSEMLSDHSKLGFLVSVREGPREIYATPGAREAGGAEWAQDVTLALPGIAWQVTVWPGPEVLSRMRSSLPELAAVLGGMLGSALLVTLLLVKDAKARSRELRQSHDQLDLRVQQRTAELQHANQHLETQIAERVRAEDSL
ncbi:MAG: hypothetical protein EHM13_11015, partial [Acidobacteria bacterium]